jgi:hypothetical protein
LTPFSYSNRSWPVGPARERLRRGPRHDGVHGVVVPSGGGGGRTSRRRVDTSRPSETRRFTRGGRAPWPGAASLLARSGPEPEQSGNPRRERPAAGQAPADGHRDPFVPLSARTSSTGPSVSRTESGASPTRGTCPGVSRSAGALWRSWTARPTSRQRGRRRSDRSRSVREKSGSPSPSRHGRRTVGRPPVDEFSADRNRVHRF